MSRIAKKERKKEKAISNYIIFFQYIRLDRLDRSPLRPHKSITHTPHRPTFTSFAGVIHHTLLGTLIEQFSSNDYRRRQSVFSFLFNYAFRLLCNDAIMSEH